MLESSPSILEDLNSGKGKWTYNRRIFKINEKKLQGRKFGFKTKERLLNEKKFQRKVCIIFSV